MLKRKYAEDFNFTARIGILFTIIFIFLIFMGSCVEDEPDLISPVSPLKEAQAQEPTPTPKPRTLTEEIEYVFGEQAELAKSVAFCESSLNPYSESKKSSASGLFQIMDGTWKTFKCSGDPLNYVDNIKCAKKIYDYYGEFGTRGGWKASYQCWSK